MLDFDRFYIRTMRTKDIPFIIKLLQSKSAKMLSLDFGDDSDVQSIEEHLQKQLAENSSSLTFVAFLKKSNNLLGYIAIQEIDWMYGTGELSIIIDEKYQSIGYGVLVLNCIAEYCFKELNLAKLCSKIRYDNTFIPERVEGQLLRDIPIYEGYKTSFFYSDIIREDIEI
ncbi:MAG: GNAT family N-acetyltransferase [Bacillota bacterium]